MVLSLSNRDLFKFFHNGYGLSIPTGFRNQVFIHVCFSLYSYILKIHDFGTS